MVGVFYSEDGVTEKNVQYLIHVVVHEFAHLVFSIVKPEKLGAGFCLCCSKYSLGKLEIFPDDKSDSFEISCCSEVSMFSSSLCMLCTGAFWTVAKR